MYKSTVVVPVLALALLLADGAVTYACAPAPHADDMIAIVDETAIDGIESPHVFARSR